MPSRKHDFTQTILETLSKYTDADAEDILECSSLIQYLNIKTEAANRGSKACAAYGNHYAIYVLIEDYLNNKFHVSGEYHNYKDAKFSNLFNLTGNANYPLDASYKIIP